MSIVVFLVISVLSEVLFLMDWIPEVTPAATAIPARDILGLGIVLQTQRRSLWGEGKENRSEGLLVGSPCDQEHFRHGLTDEVTSAHK